MFPVYIGLGTNYGDRFYFIRAAVSFLEKQFGPLKVSSIYETSPMYDENQESFLNCVVLGHSNEEPIKILKNLLEFELAMGRTRDPARPKGPRSLDLDFLLYGEKSIANQELSLPHPGILQREFVLRPLVEIAPSLIHFPSGISYQTYLNNLSPQGVYLISESIYHS